MSHLQMRPVAPFLYKYGGYNGANPSDGYFTTDAQSFVNTATFRIATNDIQCVSHMYEFYSVQAGGVLILTSRSNDTLKFIFKVTSVLPPYITNSTIQSYTFNVLFTWGSQYIPVPTVDEFYIDFGTVDTMAQHHHGQYNQYMLPPPCHNTMIPYSPTACILPKPPCSCRPPLPTCPEQHTCHCTSSNTTCESNGEVLQTYSSTGSFLYTFDNNYGAVTNPVLGDLAPGVFRINGGALDTSTLIQLSVTDAAQTASNNALFFNGMSAGSTICLYNVSTGKRCIFKLTSISTQTSASVSTATQVTTTMVASYLFKVTPVSTNNGITPVQGDKYIVTITVAASISNAVQSDLIPTTGNTITLGSFEKAFKDIFIGPNSLWLSTFKFGLGTNGYPLLTNLTPGVFEFDFNRVLSSISTLSSYVSGPVTGGGGGTYSADLSTISTVSTNVFGVIGNVSTAGAYLGPVAVNLSTYLGNATVASNVSSVTSVISSVATTGYVLTKTGPSAYGWAAAAGGGTYSADLSTISTVSTNVFGVIGNVSTAGAYLGPVAVNLSTYLGNATVASNVSSVTSVISSVATTGYVLTKTGPSAYGWAAAAGGGSSGPLSFMVNIVYSNSDPAPQAWNDPGTLIVLNSNAMTASNAANLPTGWILGFNTSSGTGYTKFFLSTTGALNYNARQMTPINIQILYAKTITGGNSTIPQALTWQCQDTASVYSGANYPNATNGKLAFITAVPAGTFDLLSLYNGTTGNSSPIVATTTYSIPGTSNATLIKMRFEFDLSPLY